MNTENPASDQAKKAPAAALLFQAPEFVAPVFQPPVETPSNERERPKSNPRKRKSSSAESESVNSEKTADSASEGQTPKGAKSKVGTKTRSSKKGASGKASSGPAQTDDSKPISENAKTGDSNGSSVNSETDSGVSENSESAEEQSSSSTRRRRRRTRSSADEAGADTSPADQVQGLKGSTRLEAKRMRRREGRRDSRRRQSITESEFLARREAVDREMVIRHLDGADQIAILEDDILVEHFVARRTTQSIVGNIYLGRVQNVLPSMEAAFVDIGRGRNAVLYAGEVNWDALGMDGKPRRIETALKSGDTVMVQVTKDPIGHKGARLTSQITLAGRYLVFVPGSSMLGISRRLPDNERNRLKKLFKEIIPSGAGVIVRTAAEGATEEQLRDDVERLTKQWANIQSKSENTKKAPILLRGEPELVVRVVRDLFNEDFSKLVVQGNETWDKVREYVEELSPELSDRLEHWVSKDDVFEAKKVQQQLSKAMDRKVWLPSGGTLIIERTEALTVVDVNTGKFVGSGGTLEETVTRNNLEAAEEIVRQLRLRDIGGIIIIDFVDMVLESNRELVLRRLVECLGRDRTRHQVTEITSLGLVQMTRKRVGEGLVEAFSTTCEVCEGRGFIVHDHPVEPTEQGQSQARNNRKRVEGSSSKDQHANRGNAPSATRDTPAPKTESHVGDEKVRSALSAIAAATGVKNESDELEQQEPPVVRPRVSDQQAQGSKESRQTKAASRRVVTRAAGSPPVRKTAPAKDGDTPDEKRESALEAVRALFEE